MNFKTYRKQSGMTQEDVAKALGIPKKTYQNYEYEVREPDSDILCALADLYGISIDALVGRDCTISDTEDNDEAERDLIERYRSMTSEGKRVLLAIADTLFSLYQEDVSDGR